MTDSLRIVLLGKTGAGKSSLANTMFGDEQVFVTSNLPNSETKKCQSQTQIVNGRNMHLVDTPGLFDTNPNDTKSASEILKCIIECTPGPHTFLIVLKVEKYTILEIKVVNIILKYFTEEALKFTTVVFTRGDDLEGMKIEHWVRMNEALDELVQKCGGRCHVFDNKYWKNSTDPYRNNEYQVQELLNTIDKTVAENEGKHYSNKMLEKLSDDIQQEMEHLRATLGGDVSEEEIEKKAKENVFKKLWTKMKNNPAGIVLGALLGLGVMIPLVIFGLPCVVSGAVIGGVSVAALPAVGVAIEDKIKQSFKKCSAGGHEDEEPLVEQEEEETEVPPEEAQEMRTQARTQLNELSNMYELNE